MLRIPALLLWMRLIAVADLLVVGSVPQEMILDFRSMGVLHSSFSVSLEPSILEENLLRHKMLKGVVKQQDF